MKTLLIALGLVLLAGQVSAADSQTPTIKPTIEEYGKTAEVKEDGTVVVTWSNGAKYIGNAIKWRFEGQGTYIWPSGSKYVGEWHKGKKHGKGVYTHYTGVKFIGEYRDDRPFKGTWYFPKKK